MRGPLRQAKLPALLLGISASVVVAEGQAGRSDCLGEQVASAVCDAAVRCYRTVLLQRAGSSVNVGSAVCDCCVLLFCCYDRGDRCVRVRPAAFMSQIPQPAHPCGPYWKVRRQ